MRLTCITLKDGNRAKEVFESIQSGKDIAEVAKELSDSGELIGPGANAANPVIPVTSPNTAIHERTDPSLTLPLRWK